MRIFRLEAKPQWLAQVYNHSNVAEHDPQLEKAVLITLDELKKAAPVKAKRPAYPVYK